MYNLYSMYFLIETYLNYTIYEHFLKNLSNKFGKLLRKNDIDYRRIEF